VTFVGVGDSLASAHETAYDGVAGCRLEGEQHRSDIGLREL
jgi:phosphoribosylamine-glycine ligase